MFSRYFRFALLIGFFSISLFGNHSSAFAQMASGVSAQTPLDRILDQKKLENQQEKLLENQPTGDRNLISKESKRTSNNCIQVKKIEFEGATLLVSKIKQNIASQTVGKCIFNDQIGQLINDITNYYIEAGYTNARAYFRDYDPKSGTINFLIHEGKINSIILNDLKGKNPNSPQSQNVAENSFFDKTQIFFAFPSRVGKIFDIADFEQGIRQMNRLRSNNAVIDSKPAEIAGSSDIVINNYKNPNSLEFGLKYDNSGSKSTGVNNVTYSINKDNLFYLNDNIGLSQIKSERSETNMLNFSVPFGYYTLSYWASTNKYSSYAGKSRVEGTSTSHDVSLERLVFKNKKHEINLNTSLNLRNQSRKTAGVVNFNSQRLSTVRIGADYQLKLKNNLNIYSALTYSKGIEIHHAIDDAPNLAKDEARAQFKKLSYNFNLSSPVTSYFNYNLQINGQHSSDALYSSETVYVGGSRYTVRGLSDEGIHGSKGGYFRNDLSLNMGKILEVTNLKIDKDNGKILNQSIEILRKTQPFIFYDYGFARQVVKANEAIKTEYISGAGLGLKYYGQYLSGEVSYAANIKAPQYVINANDHKNSALYFGISGKYWLW